MRDSDPGISRSLINNNVAELFDWETVVANCRFWNPLMIDTPWTTNGAPMENLRKEDVFDEELMKHVEVTYVLNSQFHS